MAWMKSRDTSTLLAEMAHVTLVKAKEKSLYQQNIILYENKQVEQTRGGARNKDQLCGEIFIAIIRHLVMTFELHRSD